LDGVAHLLGDSRRSHGHLLVPCGTPTDLGPPVHPSQDVSLGWSSNSDGLPRGIAENVIHWSGNPRHSLAARISIRRMLAAQRRQCVDDRRIAVVDAGKSTLRAAVFAGGTLLVRRSLPHGLPHPAAPGAQ